MTKLVILNGPPHCGKDTAALHLVQSLRYMDVEHVKLSKPLKDFVSALSGMSQAALEANKETPSFFGMPMSYRDAQIGYYEAVSKVFGREWIARMCVNYLRSANFELAVMSDGGLQEELNTLAAAFGAQNIFVVQVFRRGCHFTDYRRYVSDPRIATVQVINQDKATYLYEVTDLVLSWLNGDFNA
jgi:hypothetical protein